MAMGAYDGAVVWGLVGNYSLYELSKFLKKKNIGLSRDDGLAVFNNHFNLNFGRTSLK